MFMDDNHLLPEWLAYHYFTLNLRYVVISPDPLSATSRDFIIDRWKGKMDIEIWKSTTYMKGRKIWKDPHKRHKERQFTFYEACMLHFKQKQKRWVTMIDLDEYLLVNPSVEDKTSPAFLPGAKNPSIQVPHSVIRFASKHMANSCVMIARRQFAPIDSDDSTVSTKLQQHYPDFDISQFQTLRWRKWGYIERTYG